MLYSAAVTLFCVGFYGTGAVIFAWGLYLQGPASWVMFLVGGWALFNSGVYTLPMRAAGTRFGHPADRKSQKQRKQDRWCDEFAPAAWHRLLAARDAAACWYDLRYIPQIPEGFRLVMEYALLVAAAAADLDVFRVALLYNTGGPALAATANSSTGMIQNIMLALIGIYFLLAQPSRLWFRRWFSGLYAKIAIEGRGKCPRPLEPHERAEWLRATGESAQAAVLALGGWDSLGVELAQICGQEHRKTSSLHKGLEAWALGLTSKFLGPVIFGRPLTPGLYAGVFLLVLGVTCAYALVQFWRVLYTRRQARHPENYSPCEFVPLSVLLKHLRKTGRASVILAE